MAQKQPFPLRVRYTGFGGKMALGVNMREEIRLELQRKIAEKFAEIRTDKPRPVMTLEEKAEVIFAVALRKMQ
jgi:hypothetical protein